MDRMGHLNNSFLINNAVELTHDSEHNGSVRNKLDVQEKSKKISSRFSKTDMRYWSSRGLFKNSYTRDGKLVKTSDYCIKVAFGVREDKKPRRETINLRTPNKTAASSLAAAFYRDLLAGGWDFAFGKLRPETLKTKIQSVTVGQFILVATKLSTTRSETLETYTKALRRLVAGVFKIPDGCKHSNGDGLAKWRAKVDSIELGRLTPSAVQEWKNVQLSNAVTNEEKGKAAITLNSILRNSKALASKKIRRFLEEQLTLPSPLWFEGIASETEPSLRYQSKIDAAKIIKAAKLELATRPEVYKTLLLTLVCGLRRSEADTLLWSQIDLKAGSISIQDTFAKRLKSTDSAGIIGLDHELIPVFKQFQESAKGEFFLEATPRSLLDKRKRSSRGYRCDATQRDLIEWLKEKGVPGPRPIHTMRKEIGSIIATREGIFKASRFLRHGDIQITAKLYADSKTPVSAGLGGLFV